MTLDDELLLDTPASRPCHHPRANHQHGTYGAYKSDRCRCRPCVEAKSAYDTGRYRQIAYGRWQAFADPEPVRAHVQDLIRAGLSWRTVAHRAELDDQTVKDLLYGRNGIPVKRVRNRTARQLLAVKAGRRRTPQPPDLLTTEADT